MAASSIDPQFQELTLEAGVKIWRIEDFEVVPVPEAHYGQFYEGDAYIVYAGIAKGTDVEAHVHFFLGKECSQDESGTAALKAVELDQALGDAPTQHREVQGHESSLFMSHFRSKGGVEYLPGGVASGFNHVEPETYETRLLQIKGRRTVRTQQVELSAAAMNQGDVFILDAGMRLYLWCGPEANRYEKSKGVDVLQRLDDTRGGKPERIIMADASEEEAAEFWGALGGSEDDVQPASAGGDDEDASSGGAARLFAVATDADGALETAEIEAGEHGLERSALEDDGVFIVDAGNSVYAWVGSAAGAEEKASAVVVAQKYIQSQDDKPSWVSATVVKQHMEPAEFQGLFASWSPFKPFDFSAPPSSSVAKDLPKEAIDFARLHAPVESEAPPPGIASATVRAFRVIDTDVEPVPEEDVGSFFAGDSYIVHASGDFGDLLYFWLGRNSSQIERGTAAVKTVSMSDELGGGVPQIRVVQGREPPHFCALFSGGMVVHSNGSGGHLSEEEAAATALYHVKGALPGTSKAVEVEATAANLNSGDCFILVRGAEGVTVWRGKGASDEEKSVASSIGSELAARAGSEATEVDEGEEEDAFWEALGGRADYPEALAGPPPPMPPRLFQVSNETGTLRMDEVANFSQEDLLEDDVMLLDTFNQVFVWVGPGANDEERKSAESVAKRYLEAAGAGRDADVPVMMERAGKETPMFTSNFQGWEAAQAAVFVDPYELKMQKIREEKEQRQAEREAADAARAAATAAEEPAAEEPAAEEPADDDDEPEDAAPAAAEEAAEEAAEAPAAAAASASASADDAEAARIRASNDDSETKARLAAAEEERKETLAKLSAKAEPTMLPGDHTFTMEELQACKERTPEMDIDLTQKENYLSDSDFAEAFGTGKDEFAALPKWKRKAAKQKVSLF